MSDDMEEAIAAAGPRLQQLRRSHRLTLTDVAERTGISKSTLSRLESGQRRASLELLLPLAKIYQVTLDDLVNAPASGDPRINLRPVRRDGATLLPLTRRPGGIQAFKIVLGAGGSDTPDLRTHEGYEWLYVLNGRLRLMLGSHDLVLLPGEAAEFDTRTPHWFGTLEGAGAEFLSLFGQQGEQVHFRARPKTPRRQDSAA
ncbi:XRE family transcriptional regulator [Micromonospora sp. NBC_00821]|uniref:helix-turn-helix domain-containing protein n=1 Tax=Micromonospora sp. NBC_00821 TaxID=2975977 RepID=UPI002ED42C0D|nr:XRE family transcriptional regulator [Micromonospora sp. NBC_00821]